MKRYLLRTFGCQMNVHDSQRIEEVLAERGYLPAKVAEEADVVIFNTCSVRDKAERKLASAVGALRALRQHNPELVIAVAGCTAQQHGQQLLDQLPLVNLVIGPDNISELPDLLQGAGPGAAPVARTVFDLDRPRFLGSRATGPATAVSAYVTIMKGCNQRCAFCVVPRTRGPERYRPADEILSEVRRLVGAGVREITLLGQTVNSWREPASESEEAERQFPGLLRRIASEVPDLLRLRYTAPHPSYLTAELVEAHAELDVLPWHLHLPVQSGSDRVLKRMVRRYTHASFIEQTGRLKQARPGFTLSTDLIVGFPGETEEDFEQTLSLVREAGFVSAYAFKYSPRPHTSALKLGPPLAEPVAEPVKEQRLARLLALIDAQQAGYLRSLVGSRARVLLEERNDKDRERFTGRSHRNEIVHVKTPLDCDPTGQLVAVVIEQANKHSLMASPDPAG